jgi:signal recognition particle receptor subunit beta
MVQFNFSERTIKAKVVYYGPAQSGKTTNLEQIHRITDPSAKNRLISLNTAQDRTLFFDLLPFSLGSVAGYDFKIQLYTVPGQVQYNATRRVVLAGADAVVFVADSRRSLFKENVSAFENMKVNLLANRLVPEKIPLVLQYNKRDLDDLMGVSELSQSLNPWQRPCFAAVATKGEGVIETFTAIVELSLGMIAKKYNLKDKGLDPADIPQLVANAFSSLLKPEAEAATVPRSKIVVSQAPATASAPPAAPSPAGSDGGLVAEDLLHRAIRSNVELAESLGDLVREINDGLGLILERADFLARHAGAPADQRNEAATALQAEARRLRAVVRNLGSRVAEVSPGEAKAAAAKPASGVAAPPPQRAPAPGASPTAELERILLAAASAARPTLEPHGLSVTVRVGPGSELPAIPAPQTEQLVRRLLEALSASARPGALAVRCEKKPVLLKSASGDVRREYLMLAVSNGGGPGPEEQQRVLQGQDPGPIGIVQRAVRQVGGFVRFAPLSGGGVETRTFLPMATRS